MIDDPYRVLGLAPGASQEQIKAAFRRLALEHHPDRQGGAPEAAARFRDIVRAYKALAVAMPDDIPEEPQQAPVPRAPRSMAMVETLDLGILGVFFGLMLAGVGAVWWREWSQRSQRRAPTQ